MAAFWGVGRSQTDQSFSLSLAIVAVHTAENEPPKVYGRPNKICKTLQVRAAAREAAGPAVHGERLHREQLVPDPLLRPPSTGPVYHRSAGPGGGHRHFLRR